MTTQEGTRRYRLTITLNTGKSHSFEVKRMPRAWKSWLMQQLPYGSDCYAAVFEREAI